MLDEVNAGFELVGAVFAWKNVARLRRDKTVAGVDWRVTGFWAAWGYWNLVFYSGTGNMLSAGAGLILATANLTWCVLAWRYIVLDLGRRGDTLSVSTEGRHDQLSTEPR